MGGVDRGESSERREGGEVREGGREWWGRGGGGGRVTDGGSQGAVDLGDFVVEGEEERVTEVRGGGWVGGRWLEQFVDGGEQDAGALVGAVDDG